MEIIKVSDRMLSLIFLLVDLFVIGHAVLATLFAPHALSLLGKSSIIL